MNATLALSLALAAWHGGPRTPDVDTDGDGLSDFHEVHKHRTDPEAADSDGDGVPDGDWFERREFTYTVRSVVEVLRPVTPEHLTDDFQDARVLRKTDERVQLEVVHYPFSTAAEALGGAGGPVVGEEEVARWLAPGPTSDWDPELRDALLAALAEDGIDASDPTDPRAIERVAGWLCRHAAYEDGFTSFVTAFDESGAPYLPAELAPHLDGDFEATWPRELSARGMFERAQRGSCTSSAVYLSGCLRALGVPTRTILVIPLFDAGDEREWAMARERIEEPYVRRTVLAGMSGLERSWASHTFNEVLIDGRWWRLDYDELGVGSLRRDRFGLSTHVATLHDWADARAWETIGRRQTLGLRDAVLDGANPYSALSIDDAHGEHSTLVIPEVESIVMSVEALTWTDDPGLPADVLAGLGPRGRFGLVARVTGVDGPSSLTDGLRTARKRLVLEADGHPTLGIGLDAGCWWWRGDHALVYVPFGPADRRDLALDVTYRPRMREAPGPDAELVLADGLEVTRRRPFERPVAEVAAQPMRIRGVVVDADGAPTRARVAVVTATGSVSTSTGRDGRFELEAPGGVAVLHASTTDGRVAVAEDVAGGDDRRLVVAAGAALDVTMTGRDRCRCAVFQGEVRVEDFTIRGAEESRVVVPAGATRVRLYAGDEVLAERTLELAVGDVSAVAVEVD